MSDDVTTSDGPRVLLVDDRELIDATRDLILQAYGHQRYNNVHAPTRMQWARVASALIAAGERLPEDLVRTFLGTTDGLDPAGPMHLAH
jgi:hypothetical protein